MNGKIQDVKGLIPVVSVAEMLKDSCPRISTTFYYYAYQLLDNHIITFGEDPTLIEYRNNIFQKVNLKMIVPANDLELFGDKLISFSTKSHNSQELKYIAYLAYAATTIHGPLNKKIGMKLAEYDPTSINQPPQLPTASGISRKSESYRERSKDIVLSEIAKESFRNQQPELAFAALKSLIQELEKSL